MELILSRHDNLEIRVTQSSSDLSTAASIILTSATPIGPQSKNTCAVLPAHMTVKIKYNWLVVTNPQILLSYLEY